MEGDKRRTKRVQTRKRADADRKTPWSQTADRSLETGESHPLEDRALKAAAQLMGEELLPLLGMKEKMRRIAPTEQVFLEIKDFLADFNYEMEDGTWRHLEFESDSIRKKDLRRFRADEAVISYHHEVDVITCVLCSSSVKDLKRELRQGESIYRVRVIRMKDKDADGILRKLEKKQTGKKSLTRRELLELLLSPLMGGKISQEERIKRGMELLEREREYLDDVELIQMQSVLYAFAMKFLAREQMREMRRFLKMTVLGKMLMEDGREEGRKEGRKESRTEDILALLGEIGGATSGLIARISEERDDRILLRWLKLAARADSVEQFEQMM